MRQVIGYWEPRRLLFNGLLAFTVALLLQQQGHWNQALQQLPWLMLAAVLANLCYCLAYPIDLGLQVSVYRARWLPLRPWLFLAGCLEGLALTYLVLPEVLKGRL